MSNETKQVAEEVVQAAGQTLQSEIEAGTVPLGGNSVAVAVQAASEAQQAYQDAKQVVNQLHSHTGRSDLTGILHSALDFLFNLLSIHEANAAQAAASAAAKTDPKAKK